MNKAQGIASKTMILWRRDLKVSNNLSASFKKYCTIYERRSTFWLLFLQSVPSRYIEKWALEDERGSRPSFSYSQSQTLVSQDVLFLEKRGDPILTGSL